MAPELISSARVSAASSAPIAGPGFMPSAIRSSPVSKGGRIEVDFVNEDELHRAVPGRRVLAETSAGDMNVYSPNLVRRDDGVYYIALKLDEK